MKLRFLSFIRYTLMAAVVTSLVVISGCEDDDDGPQNFGGSTLALIQDAQFKQSATVGADVALDSLVKYLTEHPELTAMLDGTTEFTLFAPSNQAFINLLATPGFPSNIALISPELIKNVLSYHFVEGRKLKADLTAGTVLTTEFTDPLAPGAAQTITVNANGTLIAAPNATNIDIDIVKSDVQSQNGVVHVVESVMIPPSTGAVLVPILGKVAGTILLGKSFTNLAKIVMAADAVFTEDQGAGQFKVSTWLAMPIAEEGAPSANVQGITFFAPPNDVLGTPVLTEDLANTIIASQDKGRSFLLNHLVTSDQYSLADLPAAIVPLSGATKTIYVAESAPSAQNPLGVAISNTPAVQTSFRPIVQADLAHSNGVLHAFAGVLQ